MNRINLRLRGAVAAASAAAMLITAAAASADDRTGRHAIADSAPRWLSQAKTLGATPGNERIDFGLLVNMRNSGDAVAILQRISDPHSRDYGQWLSNGDFRNRFAPAAADVVAVRHWLAAEGFTVEKTLPSGMYVEASGTTKRINKVFGTTVENYDYQGETVRANAGALSFPAGTPASVVNQVGGVLGVDQGVQMHKADDLEPGPRSGTRTAEPCSDYYGQKVATDQPSFNGVKQPYAVCGYRPDQLQSAYGESSLLHAGVDGRGVTVAEILPYASPTMLSDAQKYNEVYHQPAFRPGQYRQITPGPDGYQQIAECDPQHFYTEQTLDVEAIHTAAPGADIVYVGAADCNLGLTNAWAEAIDGHVADIVTDSWGSGVDDVDALGPEVVKFFDQFALEAALTGITVTFASGDAGDNTAGGTDVAAKTVSFPADQPYVTGVGGTTLAVGRDGRREFENGFESGLAAPDGKGGWGRSRFALGGGGGTSAVYPQPFYQRGKVSAADSEFFGSPPMRTVPDIAMDGDPSTGLLVGQTQVFPEGTHWEQSAMAGTSLAAPLLAGVIAVADQRRDHRIGFLNPLLYEELGTPALHDVTAPAKPGALVRADYQNDLDSHGGTLFRLETIDTQTTTIRDRPGYDTETGVGTPNGPQFFEMDGTSGAPDPSGSGALSRR